MRVIVIASRSPSLHLPVPHQPSARQAQFLETTLKVETG